MVETINQVLKNFVHTADKRLKMVPTQTLHEKIAANNTLLDRLA